MTMMFRNTTKSQALWTDIGEALSRVSGIQSEANPLQVVSGGDINQAVRIWHGSQDYFVKLNRAERISMFEAEADGLEELAFSETLRCPRAWVSGCSGDTAYLVLEFLELGGPPSAHAFGQGLADMHRQVSEAYGWGRDNTIGATPQPNSWKDSWVEFLREHRLGFQLELARKNGYGHSLYDQGHDLLECLGAFFTEHHPAASLLHGDLWGGNYGYLANGEPVIFDPAVYYGDRESDLAMTELFGGFSTEFYAAYETAWPLDDGYPVRRRLYQLYHVLNHLNLFGTGYRSRAETLVAGLLAEVR